MEANTLIKGDVYLTDYCFPNQMHPAGKMQLLESEEFYSPMGGNIAAFSNSDSLVFYQNKIGAARIEHVLDR
jgi:hypothetical protein